ncbi:MAG: hypothetical protein RBT11_17915 [Desulfobacterales bacterium]|nr:hypothetical protein [Desulfobacterales bacterium]
MTHRTATNWMSVAETFKLETVSNFTNFQAKALYLLAAPSTPEPARVEGCFPWSHKTANKMMAVAETFKLEHYSNLNIQSSALYLLAAPSTPEPARQEACKKTLTPAFGLCHVGFILNPCTAVSPLSGIFI